jgi:hypothetical protein
MDRIFKICDLIPKQKNYFQTKSVIDRVCKVFDEDDVVTFDESSLES